MRCASLRSSSGRSISASPAPLGGLKVRRVSARLRPLAASASATSSSAPVRGGRRRLDLDLAAFDCWRRKGGGNRSLIGHDHFDARRAPGQGQQSGGKGRRGAMIEPVRKPDDLQASALAEGAFEPLQQAGAVGIERLGLERCGYIARRARGDRYDVLDASSGRGRGERDRAILPLGECERFGNQRLARRPVLGGRPSCHRRRAAAGRCRRCCAGRRE